MSKYYLTYQLANGYINNWLVLGPCDMPVEMRPQAGETELAFRTRVLHSYDHTTSDFTHPPTELDTLEYGENKFFWEVDVCRDDHHIDRSGFFASYTYRRVWAFVRLAWPKTKSATLHLTTVCPVSVWLNGRHVRYCDHLVDLSNQTPQTYAFTISLKPGNNDLLIRMDQVALGHAALAFALRLEGPVPETARILVPTVTEEPKRRMEWERAFEYTYMDRAVYTRDDQVKLICQPDMPSWRQIVMRLQKPDGSIYAETFGTLRKKEIIESIWGVQLPSGAFQAVLMPPPTNYYDIKFRARRSLPLTINAFRYAPAPVDGSDDRLVVLMQEAQRSDDLLYAELAKMALGWWETIDTKALQKAIGRVKRAEVGTLPDLLGLIGLRLRMAHYERFPSDLLPEIDDCLLNNDYSTHPDASQEAGQILLYASRILAGQAYAKATFGAAGRTGRQERSQGEKLAGEWLKQHAQSGFAQWNAHLDMLVVALAHLADLAKSERISELAAVLLDKTLFGLATHSFRGVYGAPRAYARPLWLRSASLAPESALGLLLWGVGSYNAEFKGAASLALAGKNYQLPDIIRSIALDQMPEVWTRECQRGNGQDVNLVSYKTPDYLLSSAQDYHCGESGAWEHIWQATLGPEALAFTNHPTSFSESDSRQAGWWRGNGNLPRVAQWKDALIALYTLPQNDWLGFTHAYFPTFAFDEHVLEQGWAFARKGNGYIALYGAPAAQFIQTGIDAYRELRSQGPQCVWLCQMGRADVDGSFEEFRQRVLAKPPSIQGLSVEWETGRGDKLQFAWSGPLLVNGQEQPLTGFKQVESPYAIAEMPAETMDIVYGQDVMRLHLGD